MQYNEIHKNLKRSVNHQLLKGCKNWKKRLILNF